MKFAGMPKAHTEPQHLSDEQMIAHLDGETLRAEADHIRIRRLNQHVRAHAT